MNRFVQISIFVSLLFTSCDQSKDKLYNDKIKSAIQLQDEGKFKEALTKIDEALELDPSGVVALYQKGLTFVLDKRYDSAILFCNKAIHAKGSDTLYVELNKNNPINKDRVLQDVEMPVIRYCRGFSFYMLNDYNKALDDLEFCLSSGYNNNGSVFLYAGIIYSSRGDSARGCNYFELAARNGNLESRNYLLRNCK
jgi:tetratricopeptide (TPR) repeat protein